MSPWTTPERCAVWRRVAQLIDHRHGLRGRERAAFEDGGQVPAAHQTHDEIGRVRLAPVVVQRDDVRMLERRDHLRFGLETTDEGRVVGEVGTDDLDRHLATDSGLVGAVRRTRRTVADLLAQLVPTHRRPGLVRQRPGTAARRPISSASSPVTICSSSLRSHDDGSIPSSSPSRDLRTWYARSASACRDDRYSASIS